MPEVEDDPLRRVRLAEPVPWFLRLLHIRRGCAGTAPTIITVCHKAQKAFNCCAYIKKVLATEQHTYILGARTLVFIYQSEPLKLLLPLPSQVDEMNAGGEVHSLRG